MFRFLLDSFKPAIIFTNSIILSFLSSESFKLSSDFKFSKISIEIFHDGIFSIKIRSEMLRKRVKKFVYMNFKFNHEIYLSVLYDEYKKIVKRNMSFSMKISSRSIKRKLFTTKCFIFMKRSEKIIMKKNLK